MRTISTRLIHAKCLQEEGELAKKLELQKKMEAYEAALKRRAVESVIASMDNLWTGMPVYLPTIEKPTESKLQNFDLLASKPRVVPHF
jgi:hypothetical protein